MSDRFQPTPISPLHKAIQEAILAVNRAKMSGDMGLVTITISNLYILLTGFLQTDKDVELTEMMKTLNNSFELPYELKEARLSTQRAYTQTTLQKLTNKIMTHCIAIIQRSGIGMGNQNSSDDIDLNIITPADKENEP